MRHRLQPGLTDRVDIYRREQVDENEIGEPVYGWVSIAEGEPCQFDDESTQYVVEESGERRMRPATVTFDAAVDIQETDQLEFSSGWFEATGIDETADHRRGTTVSIVAELQESDPLTADDIVGG